jgi:hypothetical protein
MKPVFAALVLIAICPAAMADEFRAYMIEMDHEKPTVTYNPFGAVNDDFTAGRWWGSVGWKKGANFPNQSDLTIYGMWLKVKYPGDGKDSFTKTSTGGQAFPEVWRKKDGSELIFRSAVGVQPDGNYWMRVPKTTDTSLRNRFFAQLYSDPGKPDVPATSDWEKLSGPIRPALVSSIRRRIPEPPDDLGDKISMFEQSVADGKQYSGEVKRAVERGADFYGKPYFLGGSDFGTTGFFTFWLFNPTSRTYRAYSLDVSQPPGQALMKTVLFAFEQKVQWVAVYAQSPSPDKPLYVTVYP